VTFKNGTTTLGTVTLASGQRRPQTHVRIEQHAARRQDVSRPPLRDGVRGGCGVFCGRRSQGGGWRSPSCNEEDAAPEPVPGIRQQGL
jgi:hypothetical protein